MGLRGSGAGTTFSILFLYSSVLVLTETMGWLGKTYYVTPVRSSMGKSLVLPLSASLSLPNDNQCNPNLTNTNVRLKFSLKQLQSWTMLYSGVCLFQCVTETVFY